MSPETVNVMGLVFGIVASWLLAYPILWGYPKRNRLFYVDLQLANARRDLRNLEEMTDRLPSTVYSPQQKEDIKADYRQRAAPGIKALEDEKARLGDGHATLSFRLSALGMILLSAGFATQLCAALAPKPEPRPLPAVPRPAVLNHHTLPPFNDAPARELTS